MTKLTARKRLIFSDIAAIVLDLEGAYVDDPNDPGGPTNFGISLRFAGSIGLDLDGDGQTTNHDILALTREIAIDAYRKHFYEKLRCDDYDDPGVALMVFDGGVNQGVRTMAKILQMAARATPDGAVGPKTVGAVSRWSKNYSGLIDEMAARRALRYCATRNRKIYGLGWMRRLMTVHTKATAHWRL